MKKNKIPKLTIELIPRTCHYSNARTIISTKDWNKIRLESYEKANYKCEICNQIGTQQGYKHKLECHEIWEYDDERKIQKLIGLISLCPICHLTKHIGRANAMGKQPIVFKHLENVNKWNHKQVVQHVAQSFMINNQRSEHKWRLDVSILTEEPYNIVIQPTRKRLFSPKYKRKKK